MGAKEEKIEIEALGEKLHANKEGTATKNLNLKKADIEEHIGKCREASIRISLPGLTHDLAGDGRLSCSRRQSCNATRRITEPLPISHTLSCMDYVTELKPICCDR